MFKEGSRGWFKGRGRWDVWAEEARMFGAEGRWDVGAEEGRMSGQREESRMFGAERSFVGCPLGQRKCRMFGQRKLGVQQRLDVWAEGR
ncbi:hypothetical protein RRG08_000373 [Elysia crispata]|uniref:Uncharacterized protein n=1 Tax=Elysia crispata TaxID=231223 RepID=A0AAE1DQH5_9GAST|nr:hypothetical protein RRG08_000373 [Elysia crispata]